MQICVPATLLIPAFAAAHGHQSTSAQLIGLPPIWRRFSPLVRLRLNHVARLQLTNSHASVLYKTPEERVRKSWQAASANQFAQNALSTTPRFSTDDQVHEVQMDEVAAEH